MYTDYRNEELIVNVLRKNWKDKKPVSTQIDRIFSKIHPKSTGFLVLFCHIQFLSQDPPEIV